MQQLQNSLTFSQEISTTPVQARAQRCVYLKLQPSPSPTTVSGREILSGVASAKGVVTDKTTGMEARMMGEVARATAGVEIPEVNRILNDLVSIYEKNYATAPAGKTFQECYDVKKVF